MARYMVRETYTVIRYIEANSEAEAREKNGEQSPVDFDEIDNSPGAVGKIEITLDTDA